MTVPRRDPADWVGLDALDADGKPVGAILAVTATGIDVETEQGRATFPLEGAEATGTAVRLALRRDGLALPPDPPPPGRAELPAVDDLARAAIVSKLREAYALEGEGIARLEALAAMLEDAEVRHDATLHAEETRLHRAGVEERLETLGAKPPLLSGRARAPKPDEPAEALRRMVEFERREAEFYAELEELACGAGDTATAELAAAHRADELAAADGFDADLRRIAT